MSVCLLQWEKVDFFDNKVICDLIEARHQGIIALLVINIDLLLRLTSLSKALLWNKSSLLCYDNEIVKETVLLLIISSVSTYLNKFVIKFPDAHNNFV